MRKIFGAILALALLAPAAEAQTQRRNQAPAAPTTPAAAPAVRPFCSIPPALIQQQQNTYIVRATNVIIMTNSGRPCGARMGAGSNETPQQFSNQVHMELTRRPAHGTVTLTPPTFGYLPEPGYIGPDSFVIRMPNSEWTWNVSVVTPDQAR